MRGCLEQDGKQNERAHFSAHKRLLPPLLYKRSCSRNFLVKAFQSPRSHVGCSRTHLCPTLFLSTISSTSNGSSAGRATQPGKPWETLPQLEAEPSEPGSRQPSPVEQKGCRDITQPPRQTDTTTKPKTLPESSFSCRRTPPAEVHVTPEPGLICRTRWDTQPTPAMGQRHSPQSSSSLGPWHFGGRSSGGSTNPAPTPGSLSTE